MSDNSDKLVEAVSQFLARDPNKPAFARKEVEELEELKKSTLASYADKAEKDIKAKKDEFKAYGGEMRKKSQRALDAKISNRYKGLFTAQRKAGLPIGFKEEVEELDEAEASKRLQTSKLYNYAFDKATGIVANFRKDMKDKDKYPLYDRVARNAFKMGIARPLKKPNLPEESFMLTDEEFQSLSEDDKNEYVNQLMELKKSTLASYAKKASRDARMAGQTAKDFERHEKSSRKPEHKQGARIWADTYKQKAWKREAGVNRAIDKLAK